MKTTEFVNNQEAEYRNLEKCHGGEGPFRFLNVTENIKAMQFIKFIHDDIILPGASFGYHQHKSEYPMEEWYFCIDGEGVMTLDGKDYPMKSGDISVCRANGSHGIKNTGDKDMRIIVILASPLAP